MEDKRIITIMGPSGAGKTTIGNMISETYNYRVPKHCTTREKRGDDKEGFYRYLSHDDFKKYADDEKYLLWSGDSKVIRKEDGNYYGVLIDDCREALTETKKVILYVSYKDLERIIFLREELCKKGIKVQILNLTYSNFSNMSDRLLNNTVRNHTPDDLAKREKSAFEDELFYGADVRKYADAREYTDIMTVKETFDSVSKKLSLEPLHR